VRSFLADLWTACRERYSVPSACIRRRVLQHFDINTRRQDTAHTRRTATRENTPKPTDCTHYSITQIYHVSLLDEVYQWNTASTKHINFPRSCRFLEL